MVLTASDGMLEARMINMGFTQPERKQFTIDETVLTTYEVLGTAEVTVPLGTYPAALRTHTVMTNLVDGTVVSSFDSWYAKGVGMIRTAGMQLTPDGQVHEFDQALVEVRRP